jgi:hypothetical protein
MEVRDTDGRAGVKPHNRNSQHNLEVGRAVRLIVGNAIAQGLTPEAVDHRVGEQVNALAAAAYELGQREIAPSLN